MQQGGQSLPSDLQLINWIEFHEYYGQGRLAYFDLYGDSHHPVFTQYGYTYMVDVEPSNVSGDNFLISDDIVYNMVASIVIEINNGNIVVKNNSSWVRLQNIQIQVGQRYKIGFAMYSDRTDYILDGSVVYTGAAIEAQNRYIILGKGANNIQTQIAYWFYGNFYGMEKIPNNSEEAVVSLSPVLDLLTYNPLLFDTVGYRQSGVDARYYPTPNIRLRWG